MMSPTTLRPFTYPLSLHSFSRFLTKQVGHDLKQALKAELSQAVSIPNPDPTVTEFSKLTGYDFKEAQAILPGEG